MRKFTNDPYKHTRKKCFSDLQNNDDGENIYNVSRPA